MKELFTGKNKDNFEKWLENYSEKSQALIIKDLDIYPDEIFKKLPPEMQSGVATAYYDSVGYEIFIKPALKNGFRFEIGCNKNEEWIYTPKPTEYHESRPEALNAAYKKANKLLNAKL